MSYGQEELEPEEKHEILKNRIIFEEKCIYPIYWMKGTTKRVCYSGIANNWLVGRANNKWRHSDLMEILEYIENPQVQEEVVFHLDELMKL